VSSSDTFTEEECRKKNNFKKRKKKRENSSERGLLEKREKGYNWWISPIWVSFVEGRM
jgi:hypothetical protein